MEWTLPPAPPVGAEYPVSSAGALRYRALAQSWSSAALAARVHLGGSSSGIGHVPPCICEASVTVDLAIGSGYFQVPVYTLLHIPEDTHRGGAVAVVSLGPLCL